MNAKDVITIGIVGAAGVLIFLAIKRGKAIVNAVNPVNNENIIANGFDELITLGKADEGFSLGSFLFDVFNKEFDPNAPVEPFAATTEPISFIDLDTLPSRREDPGDQEKIEAITLPSLERFEGRIGGFL